MTVDKVIAKIIWLTFLAHPLRLSLAQRHPPTNTGCILLGAEQVYGTH